MAKGFDCATKLNFKSAKALRAEGFDYVARYLGNSWKTFDAAEAKAIQEAGLKLISIFEENSTRVSYFSKSQGISDAREAEKLAKAVCQPKGTAIYFTVDYDAQPSHMDEILEYVQGLNQTIVDYKVGLYGSYAVMMAVKGKVDYYWQTYAWSRGKVADHIHKHQYTNDVTIAGVALDKNEIKKEPGAWVKDTPKAPKDNKPYRLRSGSFKSAADLADAIKIVKSKGWVVYEKADSTELNPSYRFITGTFVGKDTAEEAATALTNKYGWLIYVDPA